MNTHATRRSDAHPQSEVPKTLVLRHSSVPYRTLGMFFLILCLWGFWVSYRAGKWGLFESAILVSGIYSLQIAMGLWYRISLSDGVISERAFGKPRVSIAIGDITSVGQPAPDLKTVAAMNTPLRRVTINGRAAGIPKAINVSTKHFVAEDVHLLMRAIQQVRPDLVLPPKWK